MNNFVVFGDSHSRLFNRSKDLDFYLGLKEQDYNIEVNPIPAASIKGFGNRQSKLDVSSSIVERICKDHDLFLVLAFGQVDIELGYYYKSFVEKNPITFQDFATQIVEIYMRFIDSLSIPIKKILIKGINSPVLVYHKQKAIQYTKRIITENTTDENLIKEVVHDMNQRFPSGLQRTNYHLKFNKILKNICFERGIKYFDINDDLINVETGVINSCFVPSGNDHHLVDSIYVRNLHLKSLFMCSVNIQI